MTALPHAHELTHRALREIDRATDSPAEAFLSQLSARSQQSNGMAMRNIRGLGARSPVPNLALSDVDYLTSVPASPRPRFDQSPSPRHIQSARGSPRHDTWSPHYWLESQEYGSRLSPTLLRPAPQKPSTASFTPIDRASDGWWTSPHAAVGQRRSPTMQLAPMPQMSRGSPPMADGQPSSRRYDMIGWNRTGSPTHSPTPTGAAQQAVAPESKASECTPGLAPGEGTIAQGDELMSIKARRARNLRPSTQQPEVPTPPSRADEAKDEDAIVIRWHSLIREKMEERWGDNLRRAFRLIDEDKSGALDRVEIQKLLQMLFHAQIPPHVLTSLMDLLDFDGNGKISMDEFGRFFSSAVPLDLRSHISDVRQRGRAAGRTNLRTASKGPKPFSDPVPDKLPSAAVHLQFVRSLRRSPEDFGRSSFSMSSSGMSGMSGSRKWR